MAEQPARKRGRPATRTEDWESTHKRIRLLNATFERWRALKNELKLPNDDSVASFLLSLYSGLSCGNNNSGQREEVEREEYNVSLSREVAESPSRDRSSPSRDQLFVEDDVPPCYQREDMEAIYQRESDVIRQHIDMR